MRPPEREPTNLREYMHYFAPVLGHALAQAVSAPTPMCRCQHYPGQHFYPVRPVRPVRQMHLKNPERFADASETATLEECIGCMGAINLDREVLSRRTILVESQPHVPQ